MQAAKHEALDAISRLPEDVGMDEIMYRLYVLDKNRKGRQELEQGKVTSSKELRREIETW